MKKRRKRSAIAVLLAIAFAVPAVARADDDDDHDLARDLYEHGEIRSLSDILRAVAAQGPGDVVAVDLLRLNERWVYRFQVVAPDGRRRTVDVDAGVGVVPREGAGERD